MNYKAPDNSLHFIAPEFAHLLPTGSVQITEEEAEELRITAISLPTTIDLLKKLDSENALTQRNLRETIMLMSEAFKQISGGTMDLSSIPGVAKVYEVEAEAETLRAQL